MTRKELRSALIGHKFHYSALICLEPSVSYFIVAIRLLTWRENQGLMQNILLVIALANLCECVMIICDDAYVHVSSLACAISHYGKRMKTSSCGRATYRLTMISHRGTNLSHTPISELAVAQRYRQRDLFTFQEESLEKYRHSSRRRIYVM